MTRCFAVLAAVTLALGASPAFAQGQDGTRAERNAQVIAEMLQGRFDNYNQSYFDRRLGEPEELRHPRWHMRIDNKVSIDRDRSMLDFAILRHDEDGEPRDTVRLVTRLSPEPDGWGVRMQFYRPSQGDPVPLEGCDVIWQAEAGQFRAEAESDACNAPDAAFMPRAMMLGPDDIWWKPRGDDGRPYALERARTFSCYIDVPGVGGGRDIPYQRYQLPDVHDKGDRHFVTLSDGSEVFVRLTNVRWPMNNLDNIFTRHSFVIYAGERVDGEAKEIAYSWTAPYAERIGMNLKSMLINCFMLNNEEIAPFYRDEPRVAQ